MAVHATALLAGWLLMLLTQRGRCVAIGDEHGALQQCYNVEDARVCLLTLANTHGSFDEAQQVCSKYGAGVVSVNSPEMQDAVMQFSQRVKFTSDVLISAKRLTTMQWSWINRYAYDEDESVGNQSHPGDLRIAGALSVVNNAVRFFARHPVDELHYLCQYDDVLEVCQDTPKHFRDSGSCFVLYSDQPLPWHDARNKCLGKGGDLAVLTDVRFIFIKELKPTVPFWVGLQSGWWTWSDDEDMMLSFWSHGQPSGANHFCVALSKSNSWKWRTADCDDISSAFICQKGGGRIISRSVRYPSLFLLVVLSILGVYGILAASRRLSRLLPSLPLFGVIRRRLRR